MSQIDQEGLPGEAEGQEDGSEGRMVPVGESIRYRRRAQSAEKKAEELAEELAEARGEATKLSEDLKAAQQEKELVKRLASEGAQDLEAAVLMAKARLSRQEKADLNAVVEELKREKEYLFSRGQAGEKQGSGSATRTSAGKERAGGAEGMLARAAKRAVTTRSRADLEEYMRKRRRLN